ncbi:MAG: putative Na+/H+ antiporter [Bdellovibrionia bacterium]
MQPNTFQILSSCLLGAALLHTFSTHFFLSQAQRFPKKSGAHQLFLILGNVEIIAIFWALLLLIGLGVVQGWGSIPHYLRTIGFSEPLFVLVILLITATQPILELCSNLISHLNPLQRASEAWHDLGFFLTTLVLGPLMGSLITEPAAITVTAYLLKDCFFSKPFSMRLKYMTFGTLLVNISIGGALTPFAAPPILMVAKAWHWDFLFMATHLGWKAALGVLINAFFLSFFYLKERGQLKTQAPSPHRRLELPSLRLRITQGVHVGFLVLTILNAHKPLFLVLGLLAFVLWTALSRKHQQSSLQWKEALGLALFLLGLEILGSPQSWWVSPLLHHLSPGSLFLGATALTSILDNAALTYLGAQSESLTELSRYLLVSGAIAGGGLTLIANAPNPAAFAILKESWGEEKFHHSFLLLGALIPTLGVMSIFWFLRATSL